MQQIKKVIISSLYKVGFFDLLRFNRRDQVGILMYHRFSDVQEPFRLNQKSFESQIRFLTKNYNIISLKDYADFLNGAIDSIPSNSIVLTIDDGYKDNYEFAYPILKKYSVPATIFLATDFVDKNAWLWANKLEYILKSTEIKQFDLNLDRIGYHFKIDTFSGWHQTQLKIYHHNRIKDEDEKDTFLCELAKILKVDVPDEATEQFSSLNWDQILEMGENKIEFGSHTKSHFILSRLGSNDLAPEISWSKTFIEGKINKPVTSFCYPNGQPEDYSVDVVSAVRRAGYSCAVTTSVGFNKNPVDPFLLKRMWLSFKERGDLYLSKELTVPNMPSKTHLLKTYSKA